MNTKPNTRIKTINGIKIYRYDLDNSADDTPPDIFKGRSLKDFFHVIFIEKFSTYRGIYEKGIFYYLGWAYDFRPVLNLYLFIPFRGVLITEGYAPNKTFLRNVNGKKLTIMHEIKPLNRME